MNEPDSRYTYEGFSLCLPEEWYDITESLDDPGMPITFARPDGVGALQLSAAIYRSGEDPRIETSDLEDLVDERARRRGWGEPFDHSSFTEDEIRFAAASLHSELSDVYSRLWYVSNGRSVLLVTYTCDWTVRHEEASDVDGIVRSLRFDT